MKYSTKTPRTRLWVTWPDGRREQIRILKAALPADERKLGDWVLVYFARGGSGWLPAERIERGG